VASLKKAQGEKGRAVQTVHWFGDELWEWSTSGKAGIVAPETLQGWIEEDGEAFADEMNGLDLDEDDDGGVSLQEESSVPLMDSGKGRDLTTGDDAIAEIVDMEEAAGDISQQGEARRRKSLRILADSTDDRR